MFPGIYAQLCREIHFNPWELINSQFCSTLYFGGIFLSIILASFYERVVFAQRSLTGKNVTLNLHPNLLNVKFEAMCGSGCL